MRNLTRPRSNVGFPDRLERVDPLCVFLPNLHHFTKAALANDLQQVKLLDGQRLMSSRLEVNLQVERALARCSSVPLIGCMLCQPKVSHYCERRKSDISTYLAVEHWRQVNSADQYVVSHVVLSLHTLRSPQVG